MKTITVQLPDKLAEWLKHTAEKTGVSQACIIRHELERAREGTQPFLRLAGKVSGPADLSMREGFSKT